VTVNLAAGTATGAAGNDTLININHVRGSHFGSDTLTGSNSSLTEQFEGRAGNDTIDGAGGIDMVRYDSATEGVNVNLATNTALDGLGGTDTLSNIEGIRGSSFNDILTGGNTANGTARRTALNSSWAWAATTPSTVAAAMTVWTTPAAPRAPASRWAAAATAQPATGWAAPTR
jgi:Ca2+-binding RTX toxin-like protein